MPFKSTQDGNKEGMENVLRTKNKGGLENPARLTQNKGGMETIFRTQNKRGLENPARLNQNKGGMGKILRTTYPSRVRLYGDEEYPRSTTLSTVTRTGWAIVSSIS